MWQLTAHLLGIRDTYIPGSWESANAQSRMLLDPVLAPSREGKALARELLDLASISGTGVTKPVMHSFTRYFLGDQVAAWLDVPREPTDAMVRHSWPADVAGKEGSLPGSQKGWWTMDEFLRLAVLFFLGEGRPINITMPTGNNPHYS